MREVVVFAEGPTEEQFVKRMIAPALRHMQVFVKAQTLRISLDASGGAVTFERLAFNARNTLRQKPEIVLTTFVDLYGLDTSFPGFQESKAMHNLDSRLAHLQAALHEAIVTRVGCRPERFIPYIQPHEFEALLFSDTAALTQTEPSWVASAPRLAAIRAQFATPEHINDSYETKPSRRLDALDSPTYRKVRHGPLAAERITLPIMERECHHFHGWMERLRALAG